MEPPLTYQSHSLLSRINLDRQALKSAEDEVLSEMSALLAKLGVKVEGGAEAAEDAEKKAE